MKTTCRFNRWVVTLSCVALIVPKPVIAAEVVPAENGAVQFRAMDVRLGHQGDFHGQIMNAQGEPTVGVRVELWTQGKRISHTVSDENGRFRFSELASGLHQVLAPGASGAYRLWQPSAAPPAARPAVLLVQGHILRGQCPSCPPRQPGLTSGAYDGAVMKALSNPWVFSGLLAAGIAVPIAIANSDDDEDREGS